MHKFRICSFQRKESYYKKTPKPFYITSSSVVDLDSSGNKVINKVAKVNGDAVILKFVIRSKDDILKSRHQKYELLVP
jgi:hypothetical protein